MSTISFTKKKIIKTVQDEPVTLNVPDAIYFLILRRTYDDGHQTLETWTTHDAAPEFNRAEGIKGIEVLYVKKFGNGNEVSYWNTLECKHDRRALPVT